MPNTTDFIEKFSVIVEQDGFPRIAGRVMAFLLINEGPFTLDELADQLQISKTSASTNARLLEQYNLIEREGKPGDRRDFYRLADDHWERMFDVVQSRMQKFHDIVEKMIEALPAKEKYGRARLQEAQDFHAFMLDSFSDRIKEWRQQRAKAEDK